MEALTKAGKDFLVEKVVSDLPPGETFIVQENGKRCVSTFQAKLFEQWIPILGRPLALLYSAVHYNAILVFSLGVRLVQPGFLKAVHIQMNDEYLKHWKDGAAVNSLKPDHSKTQVSCVSSIFYVGNKSFIWGANVQLGSLPVGEHANLGVHVDLSTRKTGPLDPDWKKESLDFLKSNGLTNRPMDVPSPPIDSATLHSIAMTVGANHVDYNNHANNKIYIFGGIVCIRDAMTHNKLRHLQYHTFDDVIVRDILAVFESESLVGDELRFELIQPNNITDFVFVLCYHNDKRLGYTRFQIYPLTGKSKL